MFGSFPATDDLLPITNYSLSVSYYEQRTGADIGSPGYRWAKEQHIIPPFGSEIHRGGGSKKRGGYFYYTWNKGQANRCRRRAGDGEDAFMQTWHDANRRRETVMRAVHAQGGGVGIVLPKRLIVVFAMLAMVWGPAWRCLVGAR